MRKTPGFFRWFKSFTELCFTVAFMMLALFLLHPPGTTEELQKSMDTAMVFVCFIKLCEIQNAMEENR